jgi:hypothetical protein
MERRLNGADVVGDVTIHGDNVGQAVEVVVEEEVPKVSDRDEGGPIPEAVVSSVKRPDASL